MQGRNADRYLPRKRVPILASAEGPYPSDLIVSAYCICGGCQARGCAAPQPSTAGHLKSGPGLGAGPRFWGPRRLFEDNDRVRHRNREPESASATAVVQHRDVIRQPTELTLVASTTSITSPSSPATAVDPFVDRPNLVKPNVLPGHIMPEIHTKRRPDA
jgi:hypothetical protein